MNYISYLEELHSLMDKYSDEDTDLIQLRGGLYAMLVKLESSPEYKEQLKRITIKSDVYYPLHCNCLWNVEKRELKLR